MSFIGIDRFEGAHPFTIASADRGDRTLTFQIKAMGDHTQQLASRLAAGQAVTVEGPYGRFVLDRRNRKARQLCVAGDIGVTHFMAWLDGASMEDPQPPCYVSQGRQAGTRYDPANSGFVADLPATVLLADCNPAGCGHPPMLREGQLMAASVSSRRRQEADCR